MKTNVFWAIVITVLVAWLGLMGYVIFGRGAEADKANKALKSKVSAMKSFASMDADKLPTEGLAEDREAFRVRFAKQIESAEKVFERRDEAFESLPATATDDWQARNADRFGQLESDYREFSGISTDARVPFSRVELKGTDLLPAEKTWKVTERLVRASMACQAEIESLGAAPKNDLRNADVIPGFQRSRYVLLVDLPPSQIPALLNRLLGDDVVNFDIHEVVTAKLPSELQYRLVTQVESKDQIKPEPNVRLSLTVDVLDWDPPAPAETTDTDSDG